MVFFIKIKACIGFLRQIKGFKGFHAKYRFLKVLKVPLGLGGCIMENSWSDLSPFACIAMHIFSAHMTLPHSFSDYCSRARSVTCFSWGYKYKLCYLSGAVMVTRVRVIKKYSKSACRFGYSFGVKGGAIWVNRGCRAKFSVCYI